MTDMVPAADRYYLEPVAGLPVAYDVCSGDEWPCPIHRSHAYVPASTLPDWYARSTVAAHRPLSLSVWALLAPLLTAGTLCVGLVAAVVWPPLALIAIPAAVCAVLALTAVISARLYDRTHPTATISLDLHHPWRRGVWPEASDDGAYTVGSANFLTPLPHSAHVPTVTTPHLG